MKAFTGQNVCLICVSLSMPFDCCIICAMMSCYSTYVVYFILLEQYCIFFIDILLLLFFLSTFVIFPLPTNRFCMLKTAPANEFACAISSESSYMRHTYFNLIFFEFRNFVHKVIKYGTLKEHF